LDLARYADSAGYADDPARTIWAFRDYVIRSLNDNKPFDQFTIEQIAGDLLESPTDEQIIATAFHRNTLTNNEGGTNNEEFRNVAVVDRVNTTMAVWMGTTMACAQCHTHKYDPLTHLEYFQLFDFFNQSSDADRKDEAPLFEVWTDEQRKREIEIEERLTRLDRILTQNSPEIEEAQALWEGEWVSPVEWAHLRPSRLSSRSSELQVDEKGRISVETKAEKDRYELVFDLSEITGTAITGLRLNVLEEQTRNFVLGQVMASLEPLEMKEGRKGRFVRIDLPGQTRILQLAEVEVFSGGENVARAGKISKSSVYGEFESELAFDGETRGDFMNQPGFHSQPEDDPWLEIDLGVEVAIDQIRLWNRMDGDSQIQNRIKGYRVSILDNERNVILENTPHQIPAPSHDLDLSWKRDLPFSLAAASHEQKGFPAAASVSGVNDPKKGWAIAGGTGRPQELLLVFDEPVLVNEGNLCLTLVQESAHKQHLLRSFRFDYTSDSRFAGYAVIPSRIR
ncbi:MAG: DUF1549 domain-containing protein, partial [Verrucomicrobiota bacterium]